MLFICYPSRRKWRLIIKTPRYHQHKTRKAYINMSGFETALFTAGSLLEGASLLSKQQQAKSMRNQAISSRNERVKQLHRIQQIEERERKEKLKQAQATQRARFGARGTGHGGSATAVLEGMERRSAQNLADAWTKRYLPARNKIASTDKMLRRSTARSTMNLLEDGLELTSQGYELLGSKYLNLLDD